jgi:tight adherence protein C
VIIVALLALLLIVLSVTSLVNAMRTRSARTSESLGQIASYGYTVTPGAGDNTPAPSRIDDLAVSIGDALGRRISSLREDEIQRRLIAAGVYTVGARRFLGYRVLFTIVTPLLVGWLLNLGGAQGGTIVFLSIASAVVAWVAPSFWLTRRARMRLDEIDDALPELIDLLVVTVEAGVGFAGAFRLASEHLTGPLGDEVRLTIQEQALGLSALESLESWLARCDTPSLRSFVQAMVQGEQLGVSIGQILRNLALEMRKRRRQKAEERAQKVPVKILFPLVFLIFPAMFLIILGPALFTLADTLGGK